MDHPHRRPLLAHPQGELPGDQRRVGQRTDYDRLILEVWTDGSVLPDDAVAYAAKILKDQLTIFINFEEEPEEDEEVADEARSGC